MDLIPAIDMLDGIAVRLVQGDYGRRAASLSDPARIVREWVGVGVRWLHLVDLGGAREGRPLHLDLARALVSAAREGADDVRFELGGGLRRSEDVDAALGTGVDVAVLGTAAIQDAGFLAESVARWPGRIAVSIDVRDGRIALDGWTRDSDADPVRLAIELERGGAAHVIVTDVRRDGTRSGPNLELLGRMREALPATRLVAAGGIGTVEDLRQLAALGIDGAVIGLALVDGSLPLHDALAAAATTAEVA